MAVSISERKKKADGRESTEEEWKDPRFCCLHNYGQHLITECWALHRLVHRRIEEGTLELSQPLVQRNPIPNHKGKGVAAVVIYANPGEDKKERLALPAAIITTLQKRSRFKKLFDQLELIINEWRISTEALVSICLGGKSRMLISRNQN
ncbi:hypothetical protein SO802_034049 [Lithocarpus litseifolius]|uniref:Uncharacterized protein n=1 Tax=Lithocarpus litseifolius TaxID=425828 RepID=A0AAW2BHT8_9ROSI